MPVTVTSVFGEPEVGMTVIPDLTVNSALASFRDSSWTVMKWCPLTLCGIVIVQINSPYLLVAASPLIREVAEAQRVDIGQVRVVRVLREVTPDVINRVARASGDADVVLVYMPGTAAAAGIVDALEVMGIQHRNLSDVPARGIAIAIGASL